MKKTCFFVWLAISVLIGGCQTPRLKHSDPTLPIADGPKNVASLSKSVFLVVFPDRPISVDISDEPKLFDYLRTLGPLSNFSQQIIDAQITVCKTNNTMKLCPIGSDMLTFTVFAMKDQKHFYSSYHPFFEYLKNTAHLNAKNDHPNVTADKVTKTPLPLLIYDNSGHLVFEPSKGKAYINNVSWMSLYPESKDKILTDFDFVEVLLTHEIPDAVPLEPAEVKDHEKIYLVGFPNEEQNPENLKELRNRQNISLRFSVGKYLNYNDASKKLNLTPFSELSNAMKTSATDAILYVDSPSFGGMSGGPYINQNGKVVGIHHGIRSTDHGSLSTGIKSKYLLSFPYGLKKP